MGIALLQEHVEENTSIKHIFTKGQHAVKQGHGDLVSNNDYDDDVYYCNI